MVKKMNLKNSTNVKILLLAMTVLMEPIPTWAQQFNKYNSKTRFSPNKSADTDSSSEEIKDYDAQNQAMDSDNSGPDAFGRGTGIGSVQSKVKSRVQVNLNPETAFGPEVVEDFNFPDVSLMDLTAHMQKISGINLIYDKELKGKISIMTDGPITVGDAWKAYLSALNTNNYTLVKSGAFYKIVNSRDIRYTPTKIYTGNYTPDTENYSMRILGLKHISATEVTRSFRPFMSRYGRILDIKQTNTIIIQDTGENINRLVRLIQFIDVPGHEETLQIIPVKNTSAQELAKLIDQILNDNKNSRSRNSSSMRNTDKQEVISKIIAEPRTNSIIAMANADGAKRLKDLIKQLDVAIVSRGAGKIHVYYLLHSDAETLSKTLNNLVSGASTASGKTSSRFTRLGPSGNEGDSIFDSEVKITSDKENNALVVTASPTDYLTIKDVIKKLDRARDQVYLEGMIMETSINNTNEFGLSLLGFYGSGGAGVAGSNATGIVGLLTNPKGQSLGGLFSSLGAGKTLQKDLGTGQKQEVNTVTGLIKAIATDGNTNILATPQLLAQDNTDAVFEVGETVPIKKSTTTNGVIQESNDTQRIVLSLKFTPQINKVTRFVKLKIDQNIEDKIATPQALEPNGVATTTRLAQTTVVVRDRDTISMGGLMRDRVDESINKVPLLGDIPILGWLFKSKSKEIKKINLLFFLTPKILNIEDGSSANNLLETLDTRTEHLSSVYDVEDIPNQDVVDKLVTKGKKQRKGPTYNEETNKYYRDENQRGMIIESTSAPYIMPVDDTDFFDQTPNYKAIEQEVMSKRAAVKR